MTPPRADKGDTPPKITARPTEYEISTRTSATGDTPTYQRQGTVLATSAATAIRAWCEHEMEGLVNDVIRAVPTTSITELEVKVEMTRKFTLGAPAS